MIAFEPVNTAAITGMRVFVSHSTKDRLARKVRDAVVRELGAAQHQVLVDVDILKPSDPWRNKLNVCIGLCDSAVVLLSKPALHSAWVAYEVSVLAYRAAFDPTFRLVPVFIDVDYRDLETSVLSPSQVQEWQAVRPPQPLRIPGRAAQGRIDALALEVVQELPPANAGAGAILEHKLLQLAFVLRKINDDAVLGAVCRDLALELRAWVPSDDLAHRVACALHALPGLDEAKEVLDTLRQYLPRDEKIALVLEMLDLVASAWVSDQAARQIGTRVESETGGAVSLDCAQALTAELVVARACPRRLVDDERWLVASVDDVEGEEIEEIKRKIHNAARAKLVLPDGVDLRAHLDKRLRNKKPLFVSLSSRGLEPEAMQELQDEFGGALFFWRSAGDPRPQPAPSVERLRPPLGSSGDADRPFDETEFESRYLDAKDAVTL